MAYTYDGMQKLTWEEVRKRFNQKNMAGIFYLYPDGTEAEVPSDVLFSDLLSHHNKDGEFGIEKQ